jgi:protein-tyrosine-phosphatase
MREFLKNLAVIARKRPVRIVFVCTANCARSPLAEILFEKMLMGHEGSFAKGILDRLIVESAGIYDSGLPISGKTRDILVKDEGVAPRRCDAHRGRGIETIEEPDLVLAMESGHVLVVLDQFPSWQAKTFLFDDFVKHDFGLRGRDIGDPAGGLVEDYRAMAYDVKADLVLLFNELKEIFPPYT